MIPQAVRRLALPLALIAGTGFGAEAAELTSTGVFGWGAQGTTYQIGEGRFFFLGSIVGVWLDDSGSGPLNNLGALCPVALDLDANANARGASGYCTFTDAEGDHLYVRWSCSGQVAPSDCMGTNEIYGGTGKFAGATGRSEWIGVTDAMNPDGSSSGHNVGNFVVTVPEP